MHSRLLVIGLSLAILLSLIPAAGSAQEITVATRQVPPFAMQDENGQWHGISIELWRQIAERLDLEYRFQEMGLQEMLQAVESRQAEVAVAALTITSEREKRLDFSHPFISSGLGIAIHKQSGGGWLAVTQRFFSLPFLRVMTALLGVLLLVGVLVWLFERRRNSQFGGSTAAGIGSGLWWSAVTMTTVGYGDKAPLTVGGRAVALVWMFASVIIISSFTAAIATALTVGELGGKVQGKDDLDKVRIATLANSTSAQYLTDQRLDFVGRDSLQAALELLVQGNVEAVVYDAPILRYLVRKQYGEQLTVLPGSFERQDYGMAVSSGSPLRERLNQALLESLSQPAWEELQYRYLGKRD